MCDGLSSPDARRKPPEPVPDFIRQERLYQPDINDGVRVNIAPLQTVGLLTVDVLAGKDVTRLEPYVASDANAVDPVVEMTIEKKS